MKCPKCKATDIPEPGMTPVGKKISPIPGDKLIAHVTGEWEPPEPEPPIYFCMNEDCDYTAENDAEYERDLKAAEVAT